MCYPLRYPYRLHLLRVLFDIFNALSRLFLAPCTAPGALGDLTTVFIIPQPLDYVLLHEEASHPLRGLFCSGSPTPPPGVYSARNSRIFDTLNVLLTCY